MSLGAVFTIFAGIYYYFGKMTGREYPEWAGKLHFWMMFIGSQYLPFSHSTSWAVRGCRVAISTIQRPLPIGTKSRAMARFCPSPRSCCFFGVIAYSLLFGKKITENNYWNEYADTLEWTLPAHRPEHTFEILPKQEEWDKAPAH